MYHAALLFYFALLQRKPRRPVAQDKQAAVNGTGVRCRHIVDVIHRFIGRGIGVEVARKLNTVCPTPFYKVVALEMIRPVEGHMLEEMSQSALVVVFLNRPYFLCNVKVGAMFGPVVIPYIIG